MQLFAFLCIAVWFFPCAFGYQTEFVVNNPTDGIPLTDGCTAGDSCNIRSAWSACQNLTTPSSCIIKLDDRSFYNMTSIFGALRMLPTDRIAIYGGIDTIIFGEGSSFIVYENDANLTTSSDTYPCLNITRVTIFGFGGSQNLGGAIKFSGEGSAHFHNVTFSQNLALAGGALYFQESTLGISIKDCVFHANDAIDGGAIALAKNNRHIVIANSIISDNLAHNSGGGLFINDTNKAITVRNVVFERCHATNGGGMGLSIGNRMVSVIDSVFINCTAQGYGGGLVLFQRNENVSINDSQFVHCSALGGGAIMADEENHAFTVANTAFVDCAATANHGGGVFAKSNNHQMQLINSAFEHCKAKGEGGGLFLGSGNVHASVVQTEFIACTAGHGGGLTAGFQNHHLIVQGVYMAHCNALVSGGGLELQQGNAHCVIAQSRFANCSAVIRGGAINAASDNNHLLIVSISVVDSQAMYGGGLLSSHNENVSIQHSEFRHCSASVDGGGVFLYAENRDIVLLETHLESNSAQRGGGIASYPQTRGLVIAGCSFVSNEAILDGGAILLTGGNEQFVITDAYSGVHMQVVESEHPYENVASDGLVLLRTVRQPDVETFVLHFDADTAINTNDGIFIYDQSGREVFAVFDDGYLLGRQFPPLRIEGQEFTIEFRGFESLQPPTSKADGLFGFKLYVLPITKFPTRPTMFALNKAGNTGGALHMAFYISFASIVNSVFVYNRAVSGGGAVSMRSAATGITVENSWFEENESTYV